MDKVVSQINKYWLIILLLLLTFLLRIYKIEDLFYFSYDEEIPAFIGRKLLLFGDISLLGGVAPFGFHLAPYFYWFLTLLLFLGKLNPVIWGYAGAVIATVTTLMMFLVGKEFFNKKVGFVAASFWTFSETMRKRDEAGHSRFEMIFNSIREPKEDELRNLYRIYRMLPAFVRKDLEGKFQKAYDEADELFDLESESKLHLYRPKVFLLDRGGYDSGFPKKPSEKIGIRRAADTGEMLASHEDTPEGTCKGLIFNSSIERKYSPFGKFLFRRGERFTGNLNKMVSAYKSTNNENGFINGLNRYFMLK